MQNKKHHAYTGGSVTLPLTVPEGLKSGDVAVLGSDGLFGALTTDRVTADQFKKGEHPQGFVEGQAGVFLSGISMTLNVDPAAIKSVALYGKVYAGTDGKVSGTAGGTWIGYKLGAGYIGLKAN